MALYMNFVYTRTIDAVEKEKIEDIEQILRQTRQSVNFTLNNIEKSVIEVASHNGIQIGVQGFEVLTEETTARISKFTKKQFSILKNNNPYIDKFVFITKKGHIFSSDDDIILKGDKFLKSDMYRRLLASNNRILWNYGTFDYINLKSGNEKLLFLVCKISHLENLEDVVGYCFVTINSEKFKDL